MARRYHKSNRQGFYKHQNDNVQKKSMFVIRIITGTGLDRIYLKKFFNSLNQAKSVAKTVQKQEHKQCVVDEYSLFSADYGKNFIPDKHKPVQTHLI